MVSNVGTWFFRRLAIIKQFTDQVKIKLVSQLTSWMSWVLQILTKDLNGTLISTSFFPSFPFPSVIFYLNLNETILLSSLGKSIIPSALFIGGLSL